MFEVPILGGRLLLVNPAAIRAISLVSDDIIEMPAFDLSLEHDFPEAHQASEDDCPFDGDADEYAAQAETFRVTFIDGRCLFSWEGEGWA
ncbi:hypothetical protein SAMN05877809_103193 [Rhodobacter sp. JA431]|uniref:hypothetical protein n=1 Tax=Rhodobacter sp. JA431 TaxID=570013 RepID=UPI000BD409D6|nr:hypothetical protein [Rhodobacter sp. JA431]SOC04410.1 hypothetical protein SAMN05877809_103193 [Rhodobacter sp. JA431]